MPPGSSSPTANGSVTTPGAARDRGLSAARRPDAGVVALAHLGGAARVPEHGDEDVHAAFRALHVAVEGLPEPRRVLGGDERVDEHDAVLGGDERRADVLLPLLVVGGPAPEAGGDLEHVHGETLKRTDRDSCRIVGNERPRRSFMGRTRIALVVGLAVFALAAAGCGGDDEAADDDRNGDDRDHDRGREHAQRERRPGVRDQPDGRRRRGRLDRSPQARTPSRSTTSRTSTTSTSPARASTSRPT